MILSKPLVARKKNITASIYINMDSFRVELYFNNKHQETVSHTFTDENTLFAYLEKFEVLPEDFKLSPF